MSPQGPFGGLSSQTSADFDNLPLRSVHPKAPRVLGGPAYRVQRLEKDPGMEKLIRKIKLHVKVQFGEEDGSAHLIAVSNLRLDITQSAGLWLVLSTEPSLRTARKQEAMHRQAHAWAQAPETLRSIEIPAIVEDLRDAREGADDNADWYLRIEMPGYGSCSYRVRPLFEASVVTFVVEEFMRE